MADFNNLALTTSGLKALLAAQAGTTLRLSKIGMGSGSTNNFIGLTNLVTPEVMMPISEKRIDEESGFMSIVAKMTNKDITEGFYWRETGLFFEDAEGNDVLFAYACVVDDQYDYVPAYSDKRYVKHVRIANIITDAANIEIAEREGLLYIDTLTFEEYKEFVEGEFSKKASMITKATTVYVSTSGSDNNDGSEATPLRTIQEAINRCPIITGVPAEDVSEMQYTISVAEGTYSETLRVVGKKMTIKTSGTVVLTALSISSVGQVALRGTFHFNNAGANCITLYNSKLYCFGTIKVLAGSIGIILAEGSQMVCRDGIIDINNTTWSAIQLGDAGVGYIEELIGSGNTGAGIRCEKAVMWIATNTLFTSGTPIIVADGGIVNTGILNTEDKTLFGAINEIYSKAISYGTNRIYINENNDLNDYLVCGGYKCIVHGAAETLKNCPVKVAFTLDVLPGTGEHSKIEYAIYSYIVQNIRTLEGEMWYRRISTNPVDNSIDFGEWKHIATHDTVPVNNNLLINSNFANPVNQRQYDGSVTDKSMYTIDRWKLNAGQSFDIGEDGIAFKPSSKNGFFVQRLTAKGLVGKTVTYSMRINGNTHSFTNVLSKTDLSGELQVNEKLRMFVSYDSVSDCFGVSLEIKAGATPTIEWAKLEFGEVATPYVSRLYGEELLLCKRFYQKISARESALYYVTSDALRFFLNHDIEMRVPPTMDFNNIEVTANLSVKNGFTNSNESITTRYTTLVFTKNSHGLGYSDGLSLNGTAILDAEL